MKIKLKNGLSNRSFTKIIFQPISDLLLKFDLLNALPILRFTRLYQKKSAKVVNWLVVVVSCWALVIFPTEASN